MKIIECPRDAIQGLNHFVPTELKIQYLRRLLMVGFDTLDFGSFVSPKAIPQMRDTAEVLSKMPKESHTKLLVIVANLRGAKQAVVSEGIAYLGFPLSVSETFQQRNANQTIDQALIEVAAIQELCLKHGKTLVVYISMGFGNPYGDLYDSDIVTSIVHRLNNIGVTIVSLSDTMGIANPESIGLLYKSVFYSFPNLELGVHLHSSPNQSRVKIEAAWDVGCRRFDGTLGGYGGCPMADDELVGNIDTGAILEMAKSKNERVDLDFNSLQSAKLLLPKIFHPVS